MRIRTAAPLLLLVAVAPAFAVAPPPSCDNSLPQVVAVGLPYSEGLESTAAQALLVSIFGRYAESAHCPNRTLQVNAALGTDYQILEWLGRGAVDMAVVSTLSLHLLQRDGVDLLEVPLPPALPGGWLDGAAARLRAVDIGHRDGPRNAAEDFYRFRRDLWTRAVAGDRAPAAKLPIRFVFPSHLSTLGFVVPVAETHRWLEQTLTNERPEDDRPAIRAAFWRQFFDHACFRFGVVPASGPSCRAPDQASELIEIESIAGEPSPRTALAPAPAFRFGETLGDHLVIARAAADAIVRTESWRAPSSRLGVELAPLFGRPPATLYGARPEAVDEKKLVPPAFHVYLQPDRYFGTRTFTFTVDESLRLLELHQRISARAGLALVLPGGGVKAAYQSRLIDALYSGKYLVNQHVAPKSDGDGPLAVSHVIGTSGGALLGYFVARLGPKGPWDLARVLWFRPRTGGGGKERPLDSADVFGFTDLPRYASLVAILLVFCFALALCSVPRRCWLSPDRDPAGPRAGPPTARLALLLPLTAILILTPPIVRWVSGELALEHVPEFEGLLYAVLLVFAMFADQCLVARPATPASPAATDGTAGGTGRGGFWALIAGVTLMASPVLAHYFPKVAPLLAAKIWFGAAYFGLAAPAAGLVLWAVRRRRARRRRRDLAAAVVAFAIGLAAPFAVLRQASLSLLERLDRAPLVFLALGATLVIVALVRLAQGHRAAPLVYDWLRTKTAGLDVAQVVWLAGLAAPFAVCLLILDLTRPEAKVVQAEKIQSLLWQPSKLDLPIGGLAVCLGALLALCGVVLLLRRRGDFRLENNDAFVDAVLLVIVALALIVYLVLLLISRALPTSMTLFELTPRFWVGLGIVTLVVSVAFLAWAYWQRERSAAGRRFAASLAYLCARHPNANLVTRRFVRMLIVAVGGLLWWNLLLAPGLYGNRYARQYLERAERRFVTAFDAAHAGSGASADRLTAPLLATANALRTDGTRFFLVVPGGEQCPAIHQPLGSGSTWHRYHAITAEDPEHADQDDTCVDLHLSNADDRDTLKAFVFASGSPFPIFPAHWVRPEKDRPRVALVDGGYSNNTPVEAAWLVRVESVLIVNSSNPLPEEREFDDGDADAEFNAPYGPLVANVLRLPGFLFERAQQLDRRSRANLFVVSLSPPARPDWPLLTDFRRTTVEKMVKAADDDLGLRIGMVESWGPPRFQVSVPIGAGASPSGAAGGG